MAHPCQVFDRGIGFFFGLYQLAENLESLPKHPRLIPDSLRWVATTLRIDQEWGLFAPYPFKIHGWYVIQEEGISGGRIPLPNRLPAASDFARPSDMQSLYPNGHWMAFAVNTYAYHPELFPQWGNYLCEEGKRNGLGVPASVNIYFMRLVTEADFSQSFPYKERVGHYDCAGGNTDETSLR